MSSNDTTTASSSNAVPNQDDTASLPPVSADAESSESDGGNVSEGGSKEPFSNLKLDERHFEDSKKREAKLVMGPPLGGPQSGDQVHEGDVIAENEEILADLPDDALDLELTHLRLRTLRGLGLERFTKVQVRSCSLQLMTI
jgi:protein phosphatase 1 regulatory subunit 7